LSSELVVEHDEMVGCALASHVRRRSVLHGAGATARVQNARLRVHSDGVVRAVIGKTASVDIQKARLKLIRHFIVHG
jgi:hypothetical protein